MISKITDTKIAKLMNVSRDSLNRWKNDTEKYPKRYELYKLGAYLAINEIEIEEIVGLAAKNIKLKHDIEELLDHVAGLIK